MTPIKLKKNSNGVKRYSCTEELSAGDTVQIKTTVRQEQLQKTEQNTFTVTVSAESNLVTRAVRENRVVVFKGKTTDGEKLTVLAIGEVWVTDPETGESRQVGELSEATLA
jgi:hypothetical protein